MCGSSSRRGGRLAVAAAVAAALAAGCARSPLVLAYPVAGQSAAAMIQDDKECRVAARASAGQGARAASPVGIGVAGAEPLDGFGRACAACMVARGYALVRGEVGR